MQGNLSLDIKIENPAPCKIILINDYQKLLIHLLKEEGDGFLLPQES